MSYCRKHRHMATPDAMSGRCQECEIAALRERAEKVEAERLLAKAERVANNTQAVLDHVADQLSQHLGITGTPTELAQAVGELMRFAGAAEAKLAEAREDIKALAFALRVDEGMQLESGPFRDQFKAVWQRIRDRKLLEQEVSK